MDVTETNIAEAAAGAFTADPRFSTREQLAALAVCFYGREAARDRLAAAYLIVRPGHVDPWLGAMGVLEDLGLPSEADRYWRVG